MKPDRKNTKAHILKRKGPLVKSLKEGQVTDKLEQMLGCFLAVYILSQSRRPVCEVIDRLLQIEIDAAKTVDFYMDPANRNQLSTDLAGTLAGVFSFVQLGQPKGKSQSLLKKQPI